MREKIARALADMLGDGFDNAHRDKPHWIETQGYSGDRYRDVNEPRQADYLAAADAVLDAMMEPTDLMGNGLPPGYKPGSHSATEIWRSLITAARNGA